jgi:Skp family chaperone for outer membrane proteins
MGSDTKSWREASRWLRVTALSLSALSPFINILMARLRAYAEAERGVVQQKKEEFESAARSVQHDGNHDWQERLQVIGTNLNDLLLEMRENPYSQKLLQRGEDLKERGSKLSQAVVERSGQLTQDLADRSGEISQELVERSRKAGKELAEQDRSFWIALGFTCGLVATGIVTFVLLRRRIQKSIEEELPIQLYNNPADNVTTSQARGSIYSISANGTKLEAQSAVVTKPEEALEATDDFAELFMPADAAFVGISSTKEYYPVEVPLQDLPVAHGKGIEVVYFSSEDEARQHGFTAAVR